MADFTITLFGLFLWILYGRVFGAVLSPFFERRKTVVVLPDPVFEIIPFRDCRWMLCAALYSSTLLIMYEILSWQNPVCWVDLWILRNVFNQVTRAICIFLTPFDKIERCVDIPDPIANYVIGKRADTYRDLFFSGHVAFITLNVWMSNMPSAKLAHISLLIVTIMGLLLQRAHNTIDIVVGFVFSVSSMTFIPDWILKCVWQTGVSCHFGTTMDAALAS